MADHLSPAFYEVWVASGLLWIARELAGWVRMPRLRFLPTGWAGANALLSTRFCLRPGKETRAGSGGGEASPADYCPKRTKVVRLAGNNLHIAAPLREPPPPPRSVWER